jgi:hypothetical protein
VNASLSGWVAWRSIGVSIELMSERLGKPEQADLADHVMHD